MKVWEKFHDNHDGTFVVEEKFSNTPYLNEVKQIKDAGLGMTGDNRLVGRVPMHMLAQWIKEAGVSWSDREACKEVLKRKLISGDFQKFRVWEGSY